jgi:uncharacterized protein YbjT (DUF2867 family)
LFCLLTAEYEYEERSNNMSKRDKTILVTGATGNQGGSVVSSLLGGGWGVKAFTRGRDKHKMQILEEMGAQVVTGDFNDRASLDKALKGVYGVFGVLTWHEEGIEAEIRQGETLAEAAKSAGVEHFIYSSVGGAERRTAVPHFESKWKIEKHILSSGLPSTIFRPVFFMYNFNSPNFNLKQSILDGILTLPIRPDKSLQLLAPEDLGAFVRIALENPQDYLGKSIELAGDELTMPEAAEAFSRAAGRHVRYEEMPIETVRSFSEEMALMFRWFNDKGYKADIRALRAIYPSLMTLEWWLCKTGWGKTE